MHRRTKWFPLVSAASFRKEDIGGGRVRITYRTHLDCSLTMLAICALAAWGLLGDDPARGWWRVTCWVIFGIPGSLLLFNIVNRPSVTWSPKARTLTFRSEIFGPLRSWELKARIDDLSFGTELEVDRYEDEDGMKCDSDYRLKAKHKDFPDYPVTLAQGNRQRDFRPLKDLLETWSAKSVAHESGADQVAKRAAESLRSIRLEDGREFQFDSRPMDLDEHADFFDLPYIDVLDVKSIALAELRPSSSSYWGPIGFATFLVALTWFLSGEFTGGATHMSICGVALLAAAGYLWRILSHRRRIVIDLHRGVIEFISQSRLSPGPAGVDSHPVKDIALLQICERPEPLDDSTDHHYELNVVFDNEDRERRRLFDSPLKEQVEAFGEELSQFIDAPLVNCIPTDR